MESRIYIPTENRLSAAEAMVERQAAHLSEIRQLTAEWQEFDDAYEREMTELIGKTKVRNARTKHDDLLARLRKSPELFDPSPDGEKALEAYRAQIVEERHDLYRSLRFDHAAAIELRRDTSTVRRPPTTASSRWDASRNG